MALPKLALIEQQPEKRDNVIYADFRNSLGVVGQAMPNVEAPSGGGDDKQGLKKVSENLTKLHDVIYQTIATLKSKQLLDEYIYEDQLRVQTENARESQGKFVQQLDNPGDLLGAGGEQDALLAAFASLSSALDMVTERIGSIRQTCECAPGLLGGAMGGDEEDLDIDVDMLKRRKPRPSRTFRGSRFISNREALDSKGRLKPGYEVVDAGKSGLRYRKIPGWKAQASRAVGKLISAGGRIVSRPVLAAGLGLAGVAGLASTMSRPGLFDRGMSATGSFLRSSLTTGMSFLGPVGLGAMAAWNAASNFFGGSNNTGSLFGGGGGSFGGGGAGGSWNPVPIGVPPPLTLGTGGFAIPTRGTISSGFGQRGAPRTTSGYGSTNHQGIDIAAPAGAAVVAAKPGIVTHAGLAGAYGNLIKIDHGGGVETRYGHLSSIAVRRGAEVRQGQVIGGVGSTGNSSGNHLHYELRINGRPVDPRPYVTATPVPPPPRPRERVTPPPPRPRRVVVPAQPAAAAPAVIQTAASGKTTAAPLNHQGAYLNHFA